MIREFVFVRSSFGIFDLRQTGPKQKPIILEDLGKALTSAFYSATGSYVLTTSNDDTIRIYDCRDNKSKFWYLQNEIPVIVEQRLHSMVLLQRMLETICTRTKFFFLFF